MKSLLRSKASWVLIVIISAAYSKVSFQDTGGTVKLRPDDTYNITVPEGHYVEMIVTFRLDAGLYPCLFGGYFEIRDGLNQSANLLGILCEMYSKGYVFRSSGQNMWLKFHRHGLPEKYFHISYTAKPMNVTVTPVLAQVETKQFVLYNQTSFLWCLAEGAPAPDIVWRKNGLVVQNSTSVRYSMEIVKRSNDNYSCEVMKNDEETTKEEFVLSIERCRDPCLCDHLEGTHSMISVSCGGKQLKSVPGPLPSGTVAL